MKQVFKDRIGQALKKKLDNLDIGKERETRITEEYDDDFGIAISINDEGAKFDYRGSTISLKDENGDDVFLYDSGDIDLALDDDEDGKKQALIFGYLEVADDISKIVIENIADIERKLDILSAIIDGDDTPVTTTSSKSSKSFKEETVEDTETEDDTTESASKNEDDDDDNPYA